MTSRRLTERMEMKQTASLLFPAITAPGKGPDHIFIWRFAQDFQNLDEHYKRLHNPPHYPVVISPKLERLAAEVQERILGPDS